MSEKLSSYFFVELLRTRPFASRIRHFEHWKWIFTNFNVWRSFWWLLSISCRFVLCVLLCSGLYNSAMSSGSPLSSRSSRSSHAPSRAYRSLIIEHCQVFTMTAFYRSIRNSSCCCFFLLLPCCMQGLGCADGSLHLDLFPFMYTWSE